MPDADTCLVPGCTRTRRWGEPANVKRYCEACTSDVWLGRLTGHEMMATPPTDDGSTAAVHTGRKDGA